MKIFVTGATGFIGSAVVKELITAGHTVLGVARSDEAASELTAIGASPVRATLDDLAALTRAASSADAVAHLAMNRPERGVQYRLDPEAYKRNNEMDRAAIKALLEAKRPLVMTSGAVIAAAGDVATEDDPPAKDGLGAIRGPSETMSLEAGATVMRLPISVHGPGDRGFIPGLIKVARKHGVAGYVGDGAQRWPAAHRLDVARLYRLALENPAKVAGKRLHGVAESGISTRALAEAIGAGLGVPVHAIAPAEAESHFEWLSRFVAMDIPVSSEATRRLLDWTPREPGLVSDMIQSGYFKGE